MKILVVHNSGDSRYPSGELNVVNAEAGALQSMGMDVKVEIVSNDASRGLGKIKTGLFLYWSPAAYQRMQNLIEDFSPDLVHFHTVLPVLTVSAFQACKDRHLPVIQTLHNHRWYCVEGALYSSGHYCEECLTHNSNRGIIKRCSQDSVLTSSLLTLNNWLHVKRGRLFKLVDQFLAVSDFVREKHIEAGFPVDKLTVKYNGIEKLRVSNLGDTSRLKHSLTFVGRLTPAKGTLILKSVIEKLPNVTINILGHGPEYHEIDDFCKKLNASVNMYGRVDTETVYQVMMESGCVIVPSQCAEAHPLVAIEALACGTPVVGSNRGGLGEILERSGAGIAIDPPHDVDAYVRAINSIIYSPERIAELGAAGKHYVNQNLLLENTTQQLVDIYEKVISEVKAGA